MTTPTDSPNRWPVGSWQHRMHEAWKAGALEHYSFGAWNLWLTGVPPPEFDSSEDFYRARPGWQPAEEGKDDRSAIARRLLTPMSASHPICTGCHNGYTDPSCPAHGSASKKTTGDSASGAGDGGGEAVNPDGPASHAICRLLREDWDERMDSALDHDGELSGDDIAVRKQAMKILAAIRAEPLKFFPLGQLPDTLRLVCTIKDQKQQLAAQAAEIAEYQKQSDYDEAFKGMTNMRDEANARADAAEKARAEMRERLEKTMRERDEAYKHDETMVNAYDGIAKIAHQFEAERDALARKVAELEVQMSAAVRHYIAQTDAEKKQHGATLGRLDTVREERDTARKELAEVKARKIKLPEPIKYFYRGHMLPYYKTIAAIRAAGYEVES